MTDRKLMQMALDALEHLQTDVEWQYKSPTRAMLRKVEKALRARLAQPDLQQAEQEPTAYLCENAVGHKYFRWKKPSSEYKPIALYTAHASPQRIWQGLTDEEIIRLRHLYDPTAHWSLDMFARAIEAKLREKNGF